MSASYAVGLIAAERIRQIESEGYTSENDDSANCGELAMAASVYALPAESREYTFLADGRSVPTVWPWIATYWKPTPDDRIRELVKAGALIVAEIDRLARLEATS